MSLVAAPRRSLAPLAIVSAAALLFALLLLLVRLQWAPLESVDHRAAAWLNSLVAGHAAVVRGIAWEDNNPKKARGGPNAQAPLPLDRKST